MSRAASGGLDKRGRRTQSLEAKRARESRERWRAAGVRAGVVAIAAVTLLGLSYWLVSGLTQPALGESVPELPAEHVAPGASHPPYNSKPPTSGWHYAQVPRAGVHSQPVADELQIHALEHGAVMVQYDCPSGCPDLVSQLERVVGRYTSKVLLAPYPGIGRRVAVTAWGRILYLDDFDQGKIEQFIRRYKEKGPECRPACPSTP